MTKKTLLQAALERGLADGGNLSETLSELNHYTIESVEDANALIDALKQYVQRPANAVGDLKAFHHLVGLFQAVSAITPFQQLVRHGIPLLIQAYDARLTDADEHQNELLFAVKIFARYGLQAGLDRLVQAAYHPVLREGFLWSVIFDQLGEYDPAVAVLVKKLSQPLPDGFACVAFLDWTNRLSREDRISEHPFDTNAGVQKLRTWLRSSDPNEFSFAHSSAASLPFISEPDREQLLALAMDHPDSAVQMEAAWASARLGSEAGLKFLTRLCLDRDYSTTARTFLEELGQDDLIPEAANEPEFRALADMCDWLSHPQEFGRPPDDIELYDARELFWPPTNDIRPLWLFKYRFAATEPGESDDCGLGLAGSITFSLFHETNPDMSPEDAYALHCCWELEVLEDPRAPEERTIAAGRAILEAGARGDYSVTEDDFDE